MKKSKIRLIAGLALFFCLISQAQANPAPQQLAYISSESLKEIAEPNLIIANSGDKYRLAGLYTPATMSPEASIALKDFLLNRKINLYGIKDKKLKDRYQNPIALAYIIDKGKEVSVQKYMIEKGMAYATVEKGFEDFAIEMKEYEEQAEKSGMGLWSKPEFAVRNASRVSDRNSFQIIEGIVLNATQNDSAAYLNFGDKWKKDFTVKIHKSLWKSMAKDGKKFVAENYIGQKIRARGWVINSFGPMINIDHPSQLDIISDNIIPSNNITTIEQK